MSTFVEYVLSLKDQLTPKIKEAHHHVEHMEGAFHHLKEVAENTIESLGISFALFKGFEFMKEGVEQVEKLHQAEGQLENTLENMGKFSDESFEKLIEGAKELHEKTGLSKDSLISLQSQLELVGNIGEGEMQRLIAVSADMATKFHESAEEAGNALAKAINNPEMARRLGMQLKISPEVMNHIQDLAKHGKEAQARMELLAIAESKVGGAAEASFNANPLARWNLALSDIREEAGQLGIKIMKVVAPALEWLGKTIKEVIHWLKEHELLLKSVAVAATVGAVGWGLYTLAINGAAIATRIWTGIQWLLNAAMTANPIGIVIAAIAALAGIITYCYNKFDWLRGGIWAAWAAIKGLGAFIQDSFMAVLHGLGTTLHGIFHLDFGEIKRGFVETAQGLAAAAMDLGKKTIAGYNEGVASGGDHPSLIPKEDKNKAQLNIAGKNKAIPEAKTKAEGHKSVNIHIAISGGLVHELKIITTNIKEGYGKIQDEITKALTSAVNDSQIIATN